MDPYPEAQQSDVPTSPPSLDFTQTDGPIDIENQARQRRQGGDLCAIFVHAGAGYHSVQNEKIHLAACEDASRAAMTFLRNGASAVDAVEIAIKALEDKPITNAGFGSNLTIDGNVECDATIIDHCGRSGAVGAMPCIANPVSVARLILDHSTRMLSLRRVPPNLLVGEGAMNYAAEYGMPLRHPDALVSPGAGERFEKWKAELNKAESEAEEDQRSEHVDPHGPSASQNAAAQNLVFAPCWNESQPLTPTMRFPNGEPPSQNGGSSPTSGSPPRKRRHLSSADASSDGQYLSRQFGTKEVGLVGGANTGFGDQCDDEVPYNIDESSDWPAIRLRDANAFNQYQAASQHDMPYDHGLQTPPIPYPPPPTRNESSTMIESVDARKTSPITEKDFKLFIREDDITDTVGAIAIDCFGNIAAGSSSGGIGMKHKGRVGPAALIGIGTAVIPAEADDKNQLSVASITSGTGEHMATTMAASTCANRLYTSSRRSQRGSSESTDDDTAIRCFVEQDFMGHPSVNYSHSVGAIGVLGVKKSLDGIYFYFAHNTDSFAVASMGSEDREPLSVMSRNKGDGKVITGGRKVKHRQFPYISRTTWPARNDRGMDVLGDAQASPRSTKKPRVMKGKSGKAKRALEDVAR